MVDQNKKVDQNNEENTLKQNPVLAIFDDDLQAEIFNARCHDTGDALNVEKARQFKEEYLRINNVKNVTVLNLNSLRLGVNSIISLSNILQNRNITTLNLSDNCISDYGMHAIKNIISHTAISSLNLSSNMISDSGLEMIVDELIKNTYLKSLDFGVQEGSIRKNSIGIDGAKCIAGIIQHNRYLETIKLQDNDIGTEGGEIIGASLRQNTSLKHLKISENNLKSQGAEFIIKNSLNLESLNIGKNGLNFKIGGVIQGFLENSENIRKLNLEFNELLSTGIEMISQGLLHDRCQLQSLIIRGNSIQDEGLDLLSEALLDNNYLEELDISSNKITPVGIASFAEILPTTQIKILNISKNLLGDDSLIFISQSFTSQNPSKLHKIDFSSSRIGDNGILCFLEKSEYAPQLQSVRVTDNFISEKVEKILQETLHKNKYLTEFNLAGNRLSVSCMQKIKQIMTRNRKQNEEKEPNKLKTEIYRLQYEKEKITMAKEKLRQQETEIKALEDMKINLANDLKRLQQQEHLRRQNIQQKITEQENNLAKKKEIFVKKQEEMQKIKENQENEIKNLKAKYSEAVANKQSLKIQVEQIENEIKAQDEKYLKIIDDLRNNIASIKERTHDIEKETQQLNNEYRNLMNQEKDIKGSEQAIQKKDAKK